MSARAERREWWPTVRYLTFMLLALALFGGGMLYVTSAPYVVAQPGLGSLEWVFLTCFLYGGLAVVSGALDRVRWYGPIPASAAGGYAWRRSVRSRLEALGLVAWVAFSHSLLMSAGLDPVGHAEAFWRGGDWGRLAVLGAFGLVVAWVGVMALRDVFSFGVVLTVNEEGLHGFGVPERSLSWDRIERISVNGRIKGSAVTVMMRRPDGGPGPAHQLDLVAAGMSAGDFAARVAEVAPQVEIAWPRRPLVDFSAA